MTDFGQRVSALGATEAKQDDVITALATLHTDVDTTVRGHIDGIELTLAAIGNDTSVNLGVQINECQARLVSIEADLEALVARTTHAFVTTITFDDDPTTYTATGIDVSAYRDFLLLVNVAVVDTPTDIVIRVQFSDDGSTYYNYMNGPFGDLRYEDAAGAKLEAIAGKCIAQYMRVYVAATGTGSTHKFTLTVKAALTR